MRWGICWRDGGHDDGRGGGQVLVAGADTGQGAGAASAGAVGAASAGAAGAASVPPVLTAAGPVADDGRVARALERFGLEELAERPAYDLSGGQKQLLALAGAFVRGPDLVIADEPTAYLDARNARRVADHLLSDTGHRLVLVTHDLSLAARCDEAVLFAGGSVRAVGEASDVVAVYRRVLAC